jgi:2-dehydro-3-deoxygluconokinase
VIYDRKESAFSKLVPGMIDWEAVLTGAAWFHFSGITPALAPALVEECARACDAAKRLGVRISFDPNYRSKLWTKAEAARTLRPLVHGVNLCITGPDDAVTLLGAPAELASQDSALCEWLVQNYGFEWVAFTQRQAAHGDQTTYLASLWDGSHFWSSRVHDIPSVVDRLGAGDAFAAGLIATLLEGQSASDALEFAAASGAFAHTVSGDYLRATREEVAAVARGESGGRVRR